MKHLSNFSAKKKLDTSKENIHAGLNKLIEDFKVSIRREDKSTDAIPIFNSNASLLFIYGLLDQYYSNPCKFRSFK